MIYFCHTSRFVTLFILMVFLPRFSPAATYYIDAVHGEDRNVGISPAKPWQTIAKANAADLMPGDVVLFASGAVWHEQLNVTHSGTRSQPISFGSYGGTRQPIIDGADIVRGWNLVSGNTYCAVFHSKAYKAFVDALYQQTATINRVASIALVEKTPGSLYSDDEYVYVHLADESSPNNHVIEISGSRLYNILVTSQSHLVFSGLELVRAARSGFLGDSIVDNTNGPSTNEYISLTGMTVFNWGNSFMDTGPDGGFAGIYVYGLSLPTQHAQRGWSITNNFCGIGDVQPVLTYHVSCIDIEATAGSLIDHNVIASINALGITASAFYNGDPCSSPTISNNNITMSQGNIRVAGCPDATVSHNLIHDSNGYGINLDGDEDSQHPEFSTNAHLLSNTIVNLAPSHDGKLYNGIDCNKGSSGGIADGNLIRQVSGNSLTLEADTFVPNSLGQPCSGWTLTNNLLDASQNRTVTGGPAGRTGPLYIRDLAVQGLKLNNNTYILHSKYSNGMTYGFVNASDLSHDLSLAAFKAVASNHGGAAPSQTK